MLMESTRPRKNLGKYDRLALAECIDLVINGGRTIFYNGLNQDTIQCESREEVNTLIRSQNLIRGGFNLFIPSSPIRKKAFTGPIYLKYSVTDIVERLDPELRDVTMAVRRRTMMMALFPPGSTLRWRLPESLAAFDCLATPILLLLSFAHLGDVSPVRGFDTSPISAAARVPSASFALNTTVRTPVLISCDQPSVLIAVVTRLLLLANALFTATNLRSTSFVIGIPVDLGKRNWVCGSAAF